MGNMKKYTIEFKLQMVNCYLSGEGGAKLLARRRAVLEVKICTWVSHYRLHGIEGLCVKHSSYNAQFKLQVLSYQDRKQLSSRNVAKLYVISSPFYYQCKAMLRKDQNGELHD